MAQLNFAAFNKVQSEAVTQTKERHEVNHSNLESSAGQPVTIADEQPQTNSTASNVGLLAEQQERERMRSVYATYQDNVKKVAALETQIIKAILDGEPYQTILLMALDAISRTTGDNKDVFMNACIKALNEREAKEKNDVVEVDTQHNDVTLNESVS